MTFRCTDDVEWQVGITCFISHSRWRAAIVLAKRTQHSFFSCSWLGRSVIVEKQRKIKFNPVEFDPTEHATFRFTTTHAIQSATEAVEMFGESCLDNITSLPSHNEFIQSYLIARFDHVSNSIELYWKTVIVLCPFRFGYVHFWPVFVLDWLTIPFCVPPIQVGHCVSSVCVLLLFCAV